MQSPESAAKDIFSAHFFCFSLSFFRFAQQPVTTFSFAEVKLRFGINNKIFQFLFCSALNLH